MWPTVDPAQRTAHPAPFCEPHWSSEGVALDGSLRSTIAIQQLFWLGDANRRLVPAAARPTRLSEVNRSPEREPPAMPPAVRNLKRPSTESPASHVFLASGRSRCWRRAVARCSSIPSRGTASARAALRSLPLLFAVHQLTEALVWAGVDGDVSTTVQQTAALVYVLFAFPALPTLVPTAVLLLEPRGARLRVSPFVALGVVVSTYLTYVVISGPLVVEAHPHALVYRVGLANSTLWAVLYIVAVVGPSLLSGYPSIVAFGSSTWWA